MLNLVSSYMQKNKSLREKTVYLQSVFEYKLVFNSNHEQREIVLSKIKHSFDEKDTRLDGLLLLRTVVQHCPDDTFVANVQYWTKNVLGVLTGDEDNTTSKEMACETLELIIEKIVDFPDLKKEFLHVNGQVIVQLLMDIHPEDEWVLSLVSLLAVTLKKIPSIWMNQRCEIQNVIMSLVDSAVIPDNDKLAECVVNLMNYNPSKDFKEKIFRLLIGLNRTLGLLYESVMPETYEWPHLLLPETLVPSEDFSQSYPEGRDVIFCAGRRVEIFFFALRKLLSVQATACVIPISSIFAIVMKALEISADQLVARNSSSGFGFLLVLPKVHCSALLVLEALVSFSRESLVEETPNLLKMLFHCLTRDSHSDYMNSEVKCSMYRTLRISIENLMLSNCLESYTKLFITQISYDVCIPSDVTGLNSELLNTSAKNNYVCAEALKTLSSLLYCKSKGRILREDELQSVRSLAVDLMTTVQDALVHLPAPYNDDNCRFELYNLLLNTVLHVPNSNIKIARVLFTRGRKDRNLNVQSLCHQGLAVCLSMVAPSRRFPCLHIDRSVVDGPCSIEQTTRFDSIEDTTSQQSNVTLSNSYDQPMPNFEVTVAQPKVNGHENSAGDSDDCLVEGDDDDVSAPIKHPLKDQLHLYFSEEDDEEEEDDDEGEEQDEEVDEEDSDEEAVENQMRTNAWFGRKIQRGVREEEDEDVEACEDAEVGCRFDLSENGVASSSPDHPRDSDLPEPAVKRIRWNDDIPPVAGDGVDSNVRVDLDDNVLEVRLDPVNIKAIQMLGDFDENSPDDSAS